MFIANIVGNEKIMELALKFAGGFFTMCGMCAAKKLLMGENKKAKDNDQKDDDE